MSPLSAQQSPYFEAALKGKEAIERGDLSVAADEFTKCIGYAPGEVRPRLERANVYFRQGKLDLALADAQAAIKLQPKNPDGYVVRGNILFRKGKLDEALADANRALTAMPDLDGGYALRAKIRHARKQYEGAIADYTQVTKLNPTNVGALYNRANLYAEINEHDAAISDLEVVVKVQPLDREAWWLLGNLYGRRSKLDRAEEVFTRLIELDPNDSQGYLQRGVTRAKTGSKQDEALADFSQAIALGLDNKDILGRAYTGKALVYQQRGEYELAKKELLGAIKLIPNDLTTLDMLAYAYGATLELDNAMKTADRYVALAPRSAGSYFRRAWLNGNNNDYARSEADCTKALECDPNFGMGYATRAMARFKLGNNVGAEADVASALKLNPDLAEAHRVKALMALQVGDASSAVQHATRACEGSGWKDPSQILVLVAAYGSAGRVEEAMKWLEKAEGMGLTPADKEDVARLRAAKEFVR
ncbi:tetratricopeptide repeat protein [Verrucomicrobium spinosum]|nr:tetratricopeptide repeat protein [Verrucomicrobium spinosum]